MTGPVEGLARLERAAGSGGIDALCARYGVRLLTVFGSTARGQDAPRDLDVGVLFEHDVRPDVLGLLADLADLAGTDVDLAHLNRAGPGWPRWASASTPTRVAAAISSCSPDDAGPLAARAMTVRAGTAPLAE